MISTRQLMACGLSNRAITVRARKGRLHRVHRGVYAVGCEPLTLEARSMAAVLAGGDAGVLSHFSAAAHLGLLAWDHRHPEVTVVGGTAGRRGGLYVHRARVLDPRDVMRRDGIRVTTPARTLLDLAPLLSPRALRGAARQAHGERIMKAGDLADVLARANGHRGTPALSSLVAAGPAPTRSVLENVVLELLRAAGLPQPQVNAELVIAGRRVVPDFRWPRQRIVVEADGAAWHDNRAAREADAERQALLEAHGERVVRITWEQVTRRPQQTMQRIRVALER